MHKRCDQRATGQDRQPNAERKCRDLPAIPSISGGTPGSRNAQVVAIAQLLDGLIPDGFRQQ